MAKDAKGHGSNGRGGSVSNREGALAFVGGPKKTSPSNKAGREYRAKQRELEKAYLSAKGAKAIQAAKTALHDHYDSFDRLNAIPATTQNKKY